jgi:Animal haem peroxidase
MHAQWSGVTSRVMRVLLGENHELVHSIVGSSADQHSAPYAMTEEFTAVYRMHPLLPDELRMHSLDNASTTLFKLSELQGPETRTVMRRHKFADMLYSFGIANPGKLCLHNYPGFLREFTKTGQPLLDVAAIDILRDRERGVPRYNRFRELMGKKRVATFDKLTSDPKTAAKICKIYQGNIDRVDLLVGLLAEDPPPGFGFSDTAFRVFILMASRRLKSDRFFTDDFRPEIYTEFGMDWIRSNSMKSVLLRHVPELGAALEGVKNSFAPWKRCHLRP